MHFIERIAKKIANFGESFTLNGVTYKGVFKLLDSGTMRTYLDDVEMMGVVHPGLLLVTGVDVPISEDNTLTRDSRTYTVLKTALHRIGNTTVVKIAILS